MIEPFPLSFVEFLDLIVVKPFFSHVSPFLYVILICFRVQHLFFFAWKPVFASRSAALPFDCLCRFGRRKALHASFLSSILAIL